MKKNYLLLLVMLAFSFLGISQETLVVIDRDNVPDGETTASANNPLITSTGFVRGSGIERRGGNNFSSRGWDSADLQEALTNNDYIEWSVSADALNSVEISDIDVRLRSVDGGPTNVHILYSLDNFSTTDTTLPSIELNDGEKTDYSISGQTITSGQGNTITFRLYGWGATAPDGYLRTPRRGAWNAFGFTDAGARLRGTITDLPPSGPQLFTGNAAADDAGEVNSSNGFVDGGNVTVSVNNQDSQTGDFSVEISSTNDSNLSNAFYNVPVEIGKQYTVSVWGKQIEGSDGFIATFGGVTGWQNASLTDTWTNYTSTVTATTGQMRMRFYTKIGGNSSDNTILIDNISVTEVGSNSFESDIVALDDTSENIEYINILQNQV